MKGGLAIDSTVEISVGAIVGLSALALIIGAMTSAADVLGGSGDSELDKFSSKANSVCDSKVSSTVSLSMESDHVINLKNDASSGKAVLRKESENDQDGEKTTLNCKIASSHTGEYYSGSYQLELNDGGTLEVN